MTQIRYFNNLDTIARVNRYTGDIDVNEKQMNALSSMIQRFIIEHEKGHFNLQTSNELEADLYAFLKIAGTGSHSLKSSIEALTKVLNFKNPEHYKRLNAMLINALVYDYRINKNQKAFEALVLILNQNKMNTKYNNFDPSDLLNSLGGFVGAGTADPEAKNTSGDGSFDYNQAIAVGGQIINLANDKNKPTNTSTSKIDVNITPDFTDSIFGEPSRNLQDTKINWDASISNADDAKTDNTLLYVGIGVVVLLVVGIGTWLLLRKRG